MSPPSAKLMPYPNRDSCRTASASLWISRRVSFHSLKENSSRSASSASRVSCLAIAVVFLFIWFPSFFMFIS